MPRRIALKVYGTSGWDRDAFLMPGVNLKFNKITYKNFAGGGAEPAGAERAARLRGRRHRRPQVPEPVPRLARSRPQRELQKDVEVRGTKVGEAVPSPNYAGKIRFAENRPGRLSNDSNPLGFILGGTVMHLIDITGAPRVIGTRTAGADRGRRFTRLHPPDQWRPDHPQVARDVTCFRTRSLEVEGRSVFRSDSERRAQADEQGVDV